MLDELLAELLGNRLPRVSDFRGRNHESRGAIDELVDRGQIRHHFDRYKLTLAGLRKCTQDSARELEEDLSRILEGLRTAYLSNPECLWAVEDFAGFASLDADVVRRGLSFFSDPGFSVFGSWRQDEDTGLPSEFTLTERVLDSEIPPLDAIEQSPPRAPVAGVESGKLELFDLLGDGGFADVWRGRDDIREVAVKVFRPGGEAISTYLDHARSLVRAEHPNVSHVYYTDFVTHPETQEVRPCVVMELITGVQLAEKLDSTAPLTLAAASRIGVEILGGVQHIHNRGIAHGDLHSGNVLIDSDGGVKIIDILYRGSLSIMSSAGVRQRLRWDLLQVAQMLHEVLLHTEGMSSSVLAEFATRALGSRADLAEISTQFSLATASAAPTTVPYLVSDQSNHPPQLHSVGELCTEALRFARERDRVGWKALFREARSRLPGVLLEWRNETGRNVPSGEAWLDRVEVAVEACVPLVALGMCGVEAETDSREQDHRTILEDCLDLPGWEWSGVETLGESPYSLAYVAHHMFGMQLMASGKVEEAIRLLCLPLRLRQSGRSIELWKHADVMGWPNSLGGARGAEHPQAFLRAFLGKQAWLSGFFAHPREWQRGLRSYRVGASLLELAAVAARPDEPNSYFLRVPPTFLLGSRVEQSFESALSLAVPTAERLEVFASAQGTSGDRLRELWPSWWRRWLTWLRENRYTIASMRLAADGYPQLP